MTFECAKPFTKKPPHYKLWHPLKVEGNSNKRLGNWRGSGQLYGWQCCSSTDYTNNVCESAILQETSKLKKDMIGYYAENGSKRQQDFRLILKPNTFTMIIQHEGGGRTTIINGSILEFHTHQLVVLENDRHKHKRFVVNFDELMQMELYESLPMTCYMPEEVSSHPYTMDVSIDRQSIRVNHAFLPDKPKVVLHKVSDDVGEQLTISNASYMLNYD
mmetsp:Transcript_4578/g.6750  ORF Transcript_4578/g.6750 Transcript_4578/m.6750 type:complete len:217 (+) Transcript_4578:31-681(+)